MRTNPGGQLASNEVLGRDRTIEQLWERLQTQSVVITAERRMGKTSVIKKAIAEKPRHIKGVYQELEGIRSPLKFVEQVAAAIYNELSWEKRATGMFDEWYKALSGTKIGDVTIAKAQSNDWQYRLTAVMSDLSAKLHSDELFVFFWDEFPIAIDNIRQDCGSSDAMALLDTLRSIRQTHSNLRMVYTGSVGLHHVISKLKTNGYLGTPTNDMYSLDLPPLVKADALNLARELLIGERLIVEDIEVVAQTIVAAVDGIPFYIHAIIDGLKRATTSTIADTTVLELIQDRLANANPWDIDHYQSRIKGYYGADRWLIALQTLDEVALAENPLTFQDICDRLKMQNTNLFDNKLSDRKPFDKEIQRDILTLLQQDHYLDRDATGAYQFRFKLIQQYWRSQRG